jgi:hypothetical protein
VRVFLRRNGLTRVRDCPLRRCHARHGAEAGGDLASCGHCPCARVAQARRPTSSKRAFACGGARRTAQGLRTKDRVKLPRSSCGALRDEIRGTELRRLRHSQSATLIEGIPPEDATMGAAGEVTGPAKEAHGSRRTGRCGPVVYI